jgi:hypothetical protein
LLSWCCCPHYDSVVSVDAQASLPLLQIAIFALMTMVLLPLSLRRHPCHCQAGIIALVTMVSLPLICNGAVALVAIALLLFPSWHHHPCPNGVIVITDVVALVACCQAGIIAVDAQVTSLLWQWQLLLSSQ